MAQSETAFARTPSVTEKKKRHLVNMLVWACWAVYAASMMSKKIYAVELVELTKVLEMTNAQAGFPLTCYYITYTIAQVLFAIFIHKINVKKFFLVTVSASSVLLITVALVHSLTQLTVVMALIGITHCGIWAGAMYLITQYVPEERHGYAVAVMSTGFPIGNFLAYLLSSAAVGAGNWRYAFWLSGGILLTAVVFLFSVTGRADKTLEKIVRTVQKDKACKNGKHKRGHRYSPRFVISFAVIILSALVYQMIDMPVGTYLPKLFVEEYGMSESYSILISMFLPIAVLGGPFLSTSLCSRRRIPFMKAANWFLLAALVCPVILLFVCKESMVLTLIVTVLYATLLRAFNTSSGTLATLEIDSEMNAGSITAFVNAGATVACAIVPTLFGYLFDTCASSAWTVFYLIFIGVMLCMMLINAISPIMIKKAESKKQTG